jgi:phospholipid-translocating ATPase
MGETHFHSHSPDEEALLSFATSHGVILIYRDYENITISIMGVIEDYKILQIMEFSSERKRMSVIVQGPNNQIKIYTKGADDVIFQRIISSTVIPTDSINHFASIGLRTLCMAGKVLSQREFEDWRTESYTPASTSLENRNVKVYQAYDLLETELEYFGTSAIEDALQDGVPECIQALRDGGIVVWMLTGDKKETAIQIGYSCNLIKQQSLRSIQALTSSVSTSSLENSTIPVITSTPATTILDISDGLEATLRAAQSIFGDKSLIIQGTDIARIEHNIEKFKIIASLCTSVICCRMSPLQKGQIVKLMKSTGKRSLAIGDGGNDVTMIREADVGVGISGKEGLQAVRASDFAIARFKFLKRLLFVHGRNSNRRLSLISQYTMYKSFIIALIQVLFAFVSGYSGMPVLNTYILTTYNTFFTALLPIVFLFDRDVSDIALENIPELYRECKRRSFLNYRTILLWFVFTIYQALVIAATYFWIYKNGDLWNQGFVVITCVMIVQVLLVMFIAKSINLPIILFLFGSFSCFVVVTIIATILPMSKWTTIYYAVFHLGSDPTFYFTVLIVSVTAILPAFIWFAMKQYRSTASRSLSDFIRLREQNRVRKLKETSQDFYLNLRDLILSKNKLLEDEDEDEEWSSGSATEQESLLKMHAE